MTEEKLTAANLDDMVADADTGGRDPREPFQRRRFGSFHYFGRCFSFGSRRHCRLNWASACGTTRRPAPFTWLFCRSARLLAYPTLRTGPRRHIDPRLDCGPGRGRVRRLHLDFLRWNFRALRRAEPKLT